MVFLWTAVSGWAAALLLTCGISVPYVARSASLSTTSHLKAHYYLGFLILAAALLHASIPMSAGRVRAYDSNGLLIATVALCVMVWQVTQGAALRYARGVTRQAARRAHFWTMVAIVGLVSGHIILSRA